MTTGPLPTPTPDEGLRPLVPTDPAARRRVLLALLRALAEDRPR